MQFKLFASALLAAVFTTMGVAQNGKPNLAPTPATEQGALPEAVQQQQKAQRLANQGIREKSATLLMEAAEIILKHPYKSLSATKEAKPNEGTSKTTPANQVDNNKAIAELNVQKLLEQAKGYTADESTLKAIAALEKKANEPRYGRAVYGPYRQYDQVAGYSSDWRSITFRGDERAVIAISGDGDSDLDIFVYDENGSLVASNTDGGDDCRVVWYPLWTGVFRVRVKNEGRVANNYVIATN